MVPKYFLAIYSENDDSLDFNKTLVNGTALNAVSMNNIRFLLIPLINKLSVFKFINSYVIMEKIKLLFLNPIYCMLQKTFLSKNKKQLYLTKPNVRRFLILLMLL